MEMLTSPWACKQHTACLVISETAYCAPVLVRLKFHIYDSGPFLLQTQSVKYKWEVCAAASIKSVVSNVQLLTLGGGIELSLSVFLCVDPASFHDNFSSVCRPNRHS